MDLHAGNLIKAELQKQGRSISWLAKQMGYSREYMYKMLRKEFIYSDIMIKISIILNYNFFQYYADYLKVYKNVNYLEQ